MKYIISLLTVSGILLATTSWKSLTKVIELDTNFKATIYKLQDGSNTCYILKHSDLFNNVVDGISCVKN